MSNLNAAKLARHVADIYLAGQLKPDEARPGATPEFVKLSERELAEKTGAYRDPLTGAVWLVSAKEGNLLTAMLGATLRLAPLGKNHFRSTNSNPVRDVFFETSSADKLSVMRVDTEGRKPATFEAVTLASPSAEQLAEYVGDYYNDELQVTYKIVVEDGRPFIRLGYGRVGSNFRSKNPLTPTIRDEFNGNGVRVNFIRDKRSRVMAFMLSSGRVKDLHFTKR